MKHFFIILSIIFALLSCSSEKSLPTLTGDSFAKFGASFSSVFRPGDSVIPMNSEVKAILKDEGNYCGTFLIFRNGRYCGSASTYSSRIAQDSIFNRLLQQDALLIHQPLNRDEDNSYSYTDGRGNMIKLYLQHSDYLTTIINIVCIADMYDIIKNTVEF
jgi:hypothetical protein